MKIFSHWKRIMDCQRSLALRSLFCSYTCSWYEEADEWTVMGMKLGLGTTSEVYKAEPERAELRGGGLLGLSVQECGTLSGLIRIYLPGASLRKGPGQGDSLSLSITHLQHQYGSTHNHHTYMRSFMIYKDHHYTSSMGGPDHFIRYKQKVELHDEPVTSCGKCSVFLELLLVD